MRLPVPLVFILGFVAVTIASRRADACDCGGGVVGALVAPTTEAPAPRNALVWLTFSAGSCRCCPFGSSEDASVLQSTRVRGPDGVDVPVHSQVVYSTNSGDQFLVLTPIDDAGARVLWDAETEYAIVETYEDETEAEVGRFVTGSTTLDAPPVVADVLDPVTPPGYGSCDEGATGPFLLRLPVTHTGLVLVHAQAGDGGLAEISTAGPIRADFTSARLEGVTVRCLDSRATTDVYAVDVTGALSAPANIDIPCEGEGEGEGEDDDDADGCAASGEPTLLAFGVLGALLLRRRHQQTGR